MEIYADPSFYTALGITPEEFEDEAYAIAQYLGLDALPPMYLGVTPKYNMGIYALLSLGSDCWYCHKHNYLYLSVSGLQLGRFSWQAVLAHELRHAYQDQVGWLKYQPGEGRVWHGKSLRHVQHAEDPSEIDAVKFQLEWSEMNGYMNDPEYIKLYLGA